VYDDPNDLDKE